MTDYTIRNATEHDVLDIVLAVKQFCKEVPHPAWGKFDSNKVSVLFGQLIESEYGFVHMALHDDEVVGGLVAVVNEMPINSYLVAQELMLWIDPDHRNGKTAPKMIEEYVNWAREKGCKFVRLSEIDSVLNGKAGILFKRKGFDPVETAYVKEL